MPTIPSSTCSQRLIIKSNYSEQEPKQKNILKKIEHATQQDNEQRSSLPAEKCDATLLIINNESVNEVVNTKKIVLKNIVRFIIGISIISSGIAIYRKTTSTNLNGINDYQLEYNHFNTSHSIINETKTITSLTKTNYNITNRQKNRIKSGFKKVAQNNNHPYKYYYTKEQQKVCSDIKLLEKCRKTHIKKNNNGMNFDTLILKSGKINCYCPPPDSQHVEIVHPKLLPRKYMYIDKQEAKCKTKRILKECIKIHNKNNSDGIYPNGVILSRGETDCFCPPPDGHNIEIVKKTINHQKKEQHKNKNTETIKNKTEHKELIPKKEKKTSSPLSIPQKTSTEEKIIIDDVVKNKLFNDSCVAENQRTDISSILRQIGQTLSEPLTQMAIKSRIYYNHNILKAGCPSIQDQDLIIQITRKIDQVISDIFQILPKSKYINGLQNIVSPLLIAMSDDIDGKEISPDLVEKIRQNSLFLFQDFTRSLTINDYISKPTLHKMNEKEITENEKIILYEDKKLGVKIDNEFYNINHDPSGNPYISINGDIYLVGFNREFKKWMKLSDGEDIVYSIDNKNNIHNYGISPESIKDSIIINETPDSEYINLSFNGKAPSKYIFTCGKLIEIKTLVIEGEEVIITASTTLPKRIILKNRFDWFFEEKSTTITESLASFINEEISGEELTDNNLFTMIKHDGICYNSQGETYLKYDNKYYHIFAQNIANNDYYMYTKYEEEIRISKNNVVGFKFQWSTAIQTGINTEVCGMVESTATNEYKTIIDEDAYDFLRSHGSMQGVNKNNLKEVFKGVYLDTKSNDHIFIVNNNFFTVSKYSETENNIFIKSISDSHDDIQLYVFNDLIIRKRMREINEEYIKIKNCELKRDLTGEICRSTFISKALKEKLDSVVSSSTHININDDGVVRYDSIPGCFIKDNKLYFYYEGFMFKAKESYLKTQNGNSQIKTIDLFINTLIKKNKHIASFVVDIKENKIELKEPNLFLSEKTGISPENSEYLLKNSRYYPIANFMELEQMVNEVNKHGSLKIIDPLSNGIDFISDDIIIEMCRSSFFPTIADAEFTILSLDYINDNDPFYFRSSKVSVLGSLIHAKYIVNIAIKELNTFTENTAFYIKSILRTKRTHIAKEFASQLHDKLKKIYKNLNSNNIKLVSINRTPISGQGFGPHFFHAGLDEDLRHQGTIAFTAADNTKKIYISIDKLHFIDPEHPDISLREVAAADMTDTLIHEATHIDRLTTDIFYLQRDDKGHMNPILDEVDRFLNEIKTAPPKFISKILKINSEYIKNVKIYEKWKDRLLTDKDALLYFSSYDIGILANYYLHNADFITKITRDIYQNSFVDQSQLSLLEKLSQKLNLG